ncbi:MAG: hypothetical protein EXR70_16035 [Deltaproteobacteria bacterium]|nr:hypothetical protein [Deltaproteobacteria bacterium]
MKFSAAQSQRLAITFGLFALLLSCASVPQSINLSASDGVVEPPAYGNKDYSKALAAIGAAMERDLKLPLIDVTVTIYPSQVGYEQGVISEAERDIERLRQRLAANANLPRTDDLLQSSRTMAVSSVAVGMYRKVLVNEWRVGKTPWPEWIRILAHELTHTAERELVNGGASTADQWLREGFAEWVGYKVVDQFGAETMSTSREQALDAIANVKAFQTFPALTQLVSNPQWLTWLRSLGVPATYGQAFIAVDFLIEQTGVGAVVEYFRSFAKLNNRERNFTTAFGEPMAAFDQKFSAEMARRLGK